MVNKYAPILLICLITITVFVGYFQKSDSSVEAERGHSTSPLQLLEAEHKSDSHQIIIDNTGSKQTTIDGVEQNNQCLSQDLSNIPLDTLLQNKRKIKEYWVQTYNKPLTNNQRAIIESTFAQLGFSLYLARVTSLLGNSDRTLGMPTHVTYHQPITQKQFESIKSLVEQESYSELTQYLKDNQIDGAASVLIGNKLFSLLSYLLKQLDLSAHQLLRLNESGITITLDDLSYFIKHLPEEFIPTLFQQSEILANPLINTEATHIDSLATSAIRAGKPQLAAFFVNSGSPIIFDITRGGVIDFVAENDRLFNSNDLEDFLYSSQAHTFIVKNEQSIEHINTRIPDNTSRFISLEQLLAQPQSQLEVEITTLDLGLLLTAQTGIHIDTKALKECQLNTLQALAIKTMGSKATAKKYRRILYSSERDELIAESYANEPGYELIYLKQQNQKATEAKLSEQTANNTQVAKPRDNEYHELMKTIINLATRGQWDEAETLAKQHIEQYPNIYTLLVTTAIGTRADIGLIEHFIAEGGEINEFATNLLITSNNPALANDLLGYGLNFDFKSPMDSDTVQTAIERAAYEMAEFLLQQGVETEQSDQRYDALDYALMNIGEYKDFHIITSLLNYGFIVNDGHRYLAKQINIRNSPLYQQLIAEFPIFL